jgi:hypothetical protein
MSIKKIVLSLSMLTALGEGGGAKDSAYPNWTTYGCSTYNLPGVIRRPLVPGRSAEHHNIQGAQYLKHEDVLEKYPKLREETCVWVQKNNEPAQKWQLFEDETTKKDEWLRVAGEIAEGENVYQVSGCGRLDGLNQLAHGYEEKDLPKYLKDKSTSGGQYSDHECLVLKNLKTNKTTTWRRDTRLSGPKKFEWQKANSRKI